MPSANYRDPRLEKLRDFRHTHGKWERLVRKCWSGHRRAVRIALLHERWDAPCLSNGASFGMSHDFVERKS